MATFTFPTQLNLTSAATVNGSPNLTVLASAAGSWAVVIGTKLEHPNIPANTYIIGFNSTTEVVMSNNATVTGSALIVLATNPTTINMSNISTILKVGNDVYNINGPKLLVDSHSRYGLNQTTSTAIGTVSLSATLGGQIEFNSTKVRLITYNSGSGNAPDYDTIISQGSASGKLIGVYTNLTSAPITPGSAINATGYILIRQWNSTAYTSGALTGISASSTGADRPGWIEVAAVDALAITVNRLNKFLAYGDYYDFLGVSTNGTRTTGYQIPNNGGSIWVPGVEVSTTAPQSGTYIWSNNVVTVTLSNHGYIVGSRVDVQFTSGSGTPSGEYVIATVPTTGSFTFALTGSGTGGNCTITEYEFYPNAGTQTATDTKIATDNVRGRWCWMTTGGLVTFGYDGTNQTGGYCPPSGRKIRVPNILFQCCAAAGLTVNTIPHATIASRMEFVTSGGGYVEMDKVSINWYMNFLQPFYVKLTNVFTFDGMILQECASTIAWSNVGVGQSAAISVVALTLGTCFAGGTMDKCVWTRGGGTKFYTCSYSYLNGFIITNERTHQIIGNRPDATSGSLTMTYSSYCKWVNCTVGAGMTLVASCSNLEFTNTHYYDHPATTTYITANGTYMFSFAYTNYVKIDGIDFCGLRMQAPVSGIFTAGTFSSYITLRNLGTYDNPLDAGDVRQDDVTWTRSSAVATVTKTAHGLKTGDKIYVPVSSATGAIAVASKTLTGTPTADTFTFACTNASSTSGTLSYFPTVSTYLFIAATAVNNILIQRCYYPHTVTNLFTADNTVKNLRIDNVISDYLNIFLTAALNLTIRSVSGSPSLAAQTSVYGTHRIDAFNADVTPNLTNQSWSRTTTVCTVTSTDHKLRTGLFINVNTSSDKLAVPLGVKTVTVINSYTFTFTCVNTGSASGTLSFRTVVDRICLLMNEPTADTADQVSNMVGTANFTSAGGLVLPTLGDSVTFESPTWRYGHTGFPIQEAIMAGGVISNFNLWYQIDKNTGTGYSNWNNLYYTTYVVPLTPNALACLYANVIKLNSSKYLAIYSGATFLTANVINISGDDLTPGATTVFNAVASTYIFATRMTETTSLVVYVSGGYLQTCLFTVSGDIITSGPVLTVNAAATTYCTVTRLTDTQAVVMYSEATYGWACTLNVSGTTITNGTPVQLNSVSTTYSSITRMSDTQALVVCEATGNDAECFTLNVSGTDVSKGTSIYAMAGTMTYCSVSSISSTLAVGAWITGGYVYTCTLTINGTDVSSGTNLQVTSATTTYTAVEGMSSTQAILAYRGTDTFMHAVALTIDGTDLSMGADKTINTYASSYPSLSRVSDTRAILAYTGQGGYYQLRFLDIATTDITCRDDATSGGYTFAVANGLSNLAIGDYIWGTGVGGNAKITDITDGIITVDEPHTATLYGILRFNQIRNEVLSGLGFKLKIKITSIVNNYTTAITSLSIYTDSDDTSRNKLYPLDTVNVKVTVKDAVDFSAIQNARVLLLADAGGSKPNDAVVTISNSGTKATVTHTAHNLAEGDNVQIKGASLQINNGIFAISYINADSYSYILSSAPGSSPTGTIKVTFVALTGLTDSNGVISTDLSLTSDQPVIGRVRKGTSSPYYKTATILGTIDSIIGLDTISQLIPDGN